jgi:hypothetical protein
MTVKTDLSNNLKFSHLKKKYNLNKISMIVVVKVDLSDKHKLNNQKTMNL